MLTLHFGGNEYYDEINNQFVTLDTYSCRFEHSLYTIAEWESIFKKPYLHTPEKTPEELLTYIQIMAQDEFNVNDLTEEHIIELNNYINDNRTATTLKSNGESSSKIQTSELIYAYMVNGQIPFECQHWHISRLFMLLGVIGALNSKDKKMSQEDAMRMQSKLNAERLASQQKAKAKSKM